MKKWYLNLLEFLGLKESESRFNFPETPMHFNSDDSPLTKEVIDEKKLYKEIFEINENK